VVARFLPTKKEVGGPTTSSVARSEVLCLELCSMCFYELEKCWEVTNTLPTYMHSIFCTYRGRDGHLTDIRHGVHWVHDVRSMTSFFVGGAAPAVLPQKNATAVQKSYICNASRSFPFLCRGFSLSSLGALSDGQSLTLITYTLYTALSRLVFFGSRFALACSRQSA
jgi:hypothetical protein